MNMAPLTFRSDIGVPETAAQHDANLKTIRDFCNALSALMGVALNADGTLKAGAVSTAAAIAARIITNAKLDWWFNFYGTATGTNAYTLPITGGTGFAWTAGLVFFVKFTNANTLTTCTLEVSLDGTPTGTPKPVKKNVNVDPAVGDIAAGEIAIMVYDGTNMQIVGKIPAAGVAPVITLSVESLGIAIPAVSVAIAPIPHSFAAIPRLVSVHLRCTNALGDAATGYAFGDAVDVATSVFGNGGWPWFSLFMDTTNIGLMRMSTATPIWITHKTTGVWTAIGTEANWVLDIRAWR